MSTAYEQKLHELNLDEGLLSLILSQVPQPPAPRSKDSRGIRLEVLRFLENEPEWAREAARAANLSWEVREVIARKLALQFLERNPSAAAPTEKAAAQPPAPAAVDTQLLDQPGSEGHGEYRVVFGCRYEHPTDLSSGEAAGKNPREKGGDKNAKVPDQ